MKRLAQLMGFATCFFTTAVATPRLYTVTIKVSPSESIPETFIYNTAPALENKYLCNTFTLTTVCKLPAGLYRVYVLAHNGEYIDSDSGIDTPIKINGSMTLKYDLKLKLSRTKISKANEKPFDDLLLKITGTLTKCNYPEPNEKCATSGMNVELVKQQVGFISSLHQITPWDSGGSNTASVSSARFDVNDLEYLLTLGGAGSNKTFLRWSYLGK
jgi:hypothetical protein